MKYLTCTLSFALLCFMSGCRLLEKPRAVTIVWVDERATGLEIPKQKVRGYHANDLQVRLVKEGERIALLGGFHEDADAYIFEPVVPLTLGLSYEVLAGDVLVEQITVPESEAERPQFLAAYPSQDTVPENLLKIHLHFTKPMAEGRSIQNLFLLKNERDTVRGTFLDLQPELWNNESTELTLWLDPGRIKLDLIPNKELGNPLERGVRYTLVSSPQWKSKDGKAMREVNVMSFFVAARDDRSPDPGQWRITAPASGSYDPVTIYLEEALDYTLLQDAFSILDSKGNRIGGRIQITNHERQIDFIPDEQWHAGQHILQMEGRLEDLAGNNLNKLFETDLAKAKIQKKEQATFERKFDIR